MTGRPRLVGERPEGVPSDPQRLVKIAKYFQFFRGQDIKSGLSPSGNLIFEIFFMPFWIYVERQTFYKGLLQKHRIYKIRPPRGPQSSERGGQEVF